MAPSGPPGRPPKATDWDGDGAILRDCAPRDASRYPGATEICDGTDNDCDGLTDDADADVDLSTGSDWYADSDGDGYGDASASVTACAPPSGYVAAATDCDDTDPSLNPDADEVCDGTDNDCDTLVDDADADVDLSTGSVWYADTDGDGHGDASTSVTACVPPAGYVAGATDCDDTDAADHPGAPEVIGNSDDEDCDGAEVCYDDADADGYLAGGGATRTSSDADCVDPYEGGTSTPTGDCDDADPNLNPGAAEVCDGTDNDCDTLVDDADADVDLSTGSVWYADADGDGYGDAAVTETACAMPSGHVAGATDCDDSSILVSPAASEDYANDLDDDCDGDEDEIVLNGTAAELEAGTWTVSYVDLAAGASLEVDGEVILLVETSLSVDATSSIDVTPSGLAGAGICDASGGGSSKDGGGGAGGGHGGAGGAGGDGGWAGGGGSSVASIGVAALFALQSGLDGCDGASATGGAGGLGGGSIWIVADDISILGNLSAPGEDGSKPSYDDGGGGGGAGGSLLLEANTSLSIDAATTVIEAAGGDGAKGGSGLPASGGGGGGGGGGRVKIYAPTYYVGSTAVSGTTLGSYVSVDGGVGGSAGSGSAPGVAGTAGSTGTVYVYDPTAPAVATPEYMFCADGDGDGYGDAASCTAEATAPSGYVDDDTDCDDADAGVSPGAAELCGDGVDNDCSAGELDCGLGGDMQLGDASDVLVGEAASDAAGAAVAPAGDFDGDGLADVVIGVELQDAAGTSAGAVYVTGGWTGVRSLSVVDDRWDGEAAGDGAGVAVAGAGDQDGDGYDDVLIGADGDDDGGTWAGAAYVVSPLGSGDLLSDAVKLVGETSHNYAGSAVANAGDVDGDGQADLLVGAYGAATYDGSAYLVLGPVGASLDLGAADAILTGGAVFDYAGAAVAAGDLDGDGLSDLVIGAPGYGSYGAAQIVTGSTGPSGAVALASEVIWQGSAGYAGASVAVVGDVDGDGYQEVLVGHGAHMSTSYVAWLVYGASAVPGSGSLSTLAGATLPASAGSVVAGAGDLDGDGADDLAIGAYKSDSIATDVGAVGVWFGSGALTGALSTSDAGAWIEGDATSDYVGAGVGGAGDVDGDGYDDLLVGATGYDGTASSQGSVSLWFGGSGY